MNEGLKKLKKGKKNWPIRREKSLNQIIKSSEQVVNLSIQVCLLPVQEQSATARTNFQKYYQYQQHYE